VSVFEEGGAPGVSEVEAGFAARAGRLFLELAVLDEVRVEE
jgi:hypothetical protein